MYRFWLRNHDESGFMLTELLVAAALLTVGVLSVLVVFSSTINTSRRGRVRAQADTVAMEKLESARAVSYDNVTQTYLQTNLGTTAVRGGFNFTITYGVVFVDDPSDGTGAADSNPNDYKKVTITVAWTTPIPADSVIVETLVNNNPIQSLSGVPDTVKPVWPSGNNVLTGSPQQTDPPGLGAYLVWAPNWAYDAVGVTGYLVYRKGPGDAVFLLTATEAPTLGKYLDSYVVSGSSYSYYVRPYDAAGNIGLASNTQVVVAPNDTTPPTIPTGFSLVSFDATSVTLTWIPSTDNSQIIDHYNIYRTHGGVPYGSTPYTTSVAPPFTDDGLTTGQQYQYKISAVDSAGNESGKTGDVTVTPQ